MTALVQAIVAMLTTLLPLLEQAGASQLIDKIITTLISLIPQAVQFAADEIPVIQNIIAALKSSSYVTPEQFQQLEAAEQSIDASFDAAASAAGDTGD